MSEFEFPWALFVMGLALVAFFTVMSAGRRRVRDDQPAMKACGACGAMLPANARFCSQCGRRV